MSRDFRILVLGDSNAGKSSLINTFLKDVPYVPEASTSKDENRCLPVVSLPALNVGTLYLVDSPSPVGGSNGSQLHLTSWHERQIDRADAIVVACTLEDKDGIHNEIQRWIDAVSSYAKASRRRDSRYLPLVLAATKSDLLEGESDSFDGADVRAKFPQLEAVVACSSTKNTNVAEVWVMLVPIKYVATDRPYRFWSTQQAVEFPLYPLYDTIAQALTLPAEQAFDRIYSLLARHSKTIYPSDLQELQYRVFHQHITAAEVDRLISQVVKRPSGNAGDTEDPKLALSHNDFRAFIRAFLERGRTEPVWRILQYYGYNTQLNLDTAYIRPKVGMSADGNECVELSLAGIAFLSSLWQDFQEQYQGKTVSLDHYFASAGVEPALAKHLISCTSLVAFIGQWQALAATELPQVLETLAQLGYPQSVLLEDIKPPKKHEQGYLNVIGTTSILPKHATQRKVFTALLFGDTPSRESLLSIAGGVVAMGDERYVVLLPVPDLAQLSTKRVAQADLAIYAYSHPGNNQSPSSIDHLVSIRQSAPQKVLDIPSLAVGVAREKVEIQIPDDSTSASMVTAEATEFCAASGMREPIVVETVEPLRNELSKRLNARQHSAERAPGSTNWLLWSSALVAGMAASFVILQRSGWLQVAQRYWHDKA